MYAIIKSVAINQVGAGIKNEAIIPPTKLMALYYKTIKKLKLLATKMQYNRLLGLVVFFVQCHIKKVKTTVIFIF